MQRALAFLTPFGRAAQPVPATLAWFPAVGVLLGLAVGSVWWLCSRAWPALVAAGIVVAADLALTGLLHMDGLADAGDGLLAPLDRQHRLDAMADPAVGAFGAISVAIALLLRCAAFAAVHPAVLVIAGLWCASRTAMVVVMQSLPYARPGGLAEAFVDIGPVGGRGRALLYGAVGVGLCASVALVALGRGIHGLVALGSELVAIAAVAGLARRRIGGFTGDVLGASCVVGETVGLLALVAR